MSSTRTKLRPDDPKANLRLAIGSDGVELGWEIQDGRGYRALVTILMHLHEFAWFARAAISQDRFRDHVVQEFKRDIHKELYEQAQRRADELKASFDSFEASAIKLALPGPVDVRQGPPLPFEWIEECRYCDKFSEYEDPCGICKGSRRIYVRPAPPEA